MDSDSIPRSILLALGASPAAAGTVLPGILILLVLVLTGGFFSGAETAYSFCNGVRIRMLAEDGNTRARRVERILDNFDRSIVSLLIAINLLHIGTATVATVLFVDLLRNEALGSAVATAVTTLLVFMLGETIPKNLACANADKYALLFSLPMKILLLLCKPLAYLLTGLGSAVKRLLHIGDDEPSLTGDEFAAMVEDAGDDGVMESDETEIIKSAIDFGGTTVREIMLPLAKVVAISSRESDENIRETLIHEKYSRFPVYRGNRTNIVGVLHAADTLWQFANGDGDFVLKDRLRPPYFVAPDAHIDDVFEGMCGRHSHMAVVRDSNGKATGIVTMEDILEEIVGEIYDEDDPDAAGTNGGDAR